MNTYILLLRGINVGGNNKVPMADLKHCLEELGFSHVTTYIASGNVLLDSEKSSSEVRKIIEKALPTTFKLDSKLIKVLVVTQSQLQAIIDNKPKGFGDKPDTYHSDVVFLIDIDSTEAMKVFKPKDGVDTVWQGNGVIYSQRLSAERTKSRLSAIVGTPAYACMTIRNWNTTVKLLELVKSRF
jgi:uncharacterized protein (DUF1697 family)